MLTLVSHLSTRFHRELASAAWLAALTEHLQTVIPQNDARYSGKTHAKVSSEHDEERFMGPHSAVKCRFRVDVAMARTDTPRWDRYRIWVRYVPDTGSFATERTELDTLETRVQAEREAAERAAARKATAEHLRARWQGREAIYLEAGALRVRVIDVQPGTRRSIAEVGEVPTPGLRESLLRVQHAASSANPVRWWLVVPDNISESRWQSSAWSLEFDPAFVQKVVDTAARWPGALPAFGRYCELGSLLVAR